VTDLLAGAPGWFVITVVSIVVATEPALLVGVVLPSVTSVLLLGFLSGLGAVPEQVAVPAIALAAVCGDALAFGAGRRRPPTAPAARPDRYLERGWRTAADVLARVGRPAVALARWVTVARTLVPRLAARSGMSWPRFLVLAVPSALLWSGVLVSVGHLAGDSYEQVSQAVGRGGTVLALVLLTAVAVRRAVTVRGRAVHRRSPPVALVGVVSAPAASPRCRARGGPR